MFINIIYIKNGNYELKKNINPALDSNKIVYYFGDSIYCENKDNQVAFEISLKTPFILKFQIGVLE